MVARYEQVRAYRFVTRRIVAAIKLAGLSFLKAYETGNAKGMAAHWTEEGEYFSDDGTVIRGRENIEKEYAKLFAKKRGTVKAEIDAGRPVGDNQNSLTAGLRGPVVFEDFLLFEKMAHFNRERIPERVVHAKGSGAYGHLTCTSKEITRCTTAKLFSELGKKTPTFLRFSTVGGEKGSADTERDPRGFALKFYTEEGNWNMVGNNTHIFSPRLINTFTFGRQKTWVSAPVGRTNRRPRTCSARAASVSGKGRRRRFHAVG